MPAIENMGEWMRNTYWRGRPLSELTPEEFAEALRVQSEQLESLRVSFAAMFELSSLGRHR